MFRAFGVFVLLHTGEGINALVDMIDVASIWFGGDGPCLVSFGLNGHVLGPDMRCTVTWSARSALKV
jgi:hypothetical protein